MQNGCFYYSSWPFFWLLNTYHPFQPPFILILFVYCSDWTAMKDSDRKKIIISNTKSRVKIEKISITPNSNFSFIIQISLPNIGVWAYVSYFLISFSSFVCHFVGLFKKKRRRREGSRRLGWKTFPRKWVDQQNVPDIHRSSHFRILHNCHQYGWSNWCCYCCGIVA